MLHSLRRAKLYQSKVQAFSQNGKIIQKSESEQDHHSVIKQKVKLVSISWIWLNWIDLGSLVWISLNRFELNWKALNCQPTWLKRSSVQTSNALSIACIFFWMLRTWHFGQIIANIFQELPWSCLLLNLDPTSSSTLILPPPQTWPYLLLKLVSFGLILSFDLLKVGDPRLCIRRLVRQLLHLLLDAVHLSSAIWTHVWKLGRYIWQFGQFWT